MDRKKYFCEKCNYKTSLKSCYDTHLETELHKTGKRKTRKDKKEAEKCPHCEYETKRKSTMKNHIFSKHMNEDEKKEILKYFCSDCKVGFLHKSQYNVHLISAKHKEKSERKLQ